MGHARVPAKLVVVSGLPAAGKTTLARRLAGDLGVPTLCRDDMRWPLFKMAEALGHGYDRSIVGPAIRQVYEIAIDNVLASRVPAVADANFNDPFTHTGMRELVERHRAETFEICLWGDNDALLRRWEQREGHTLDIVEKSLARDRVPVTSGTGEVREFDTTDFADLEHAYPALLADLRWFTDRLPRKKVAAGLLIRDAEGRVLLVHQDYGERVWNLPGGLVEADESPADGARRETREEVGLDLAAGRLLDVDHTAADSLVFVHDGGTVDEATAATVRLQESELDDHAWVAPADLPRHLTGARLWRVQRALGVE